jgi:hypothetical protein
MTFQKEISMNTIILCAVYKTHVLVLTGVDECCLQEIRIPKSTRLIGLQLSCEI